MSVFHHIVDGWNSDICSDSFTSYTCFLLDFNGFFSCKISNVGVAPLYSRFITSTKGFGQVDKHYTIIPNFCILLWIGIIEVQPEFLVSAAESASVSDYTVDVPFPSRPNRFIEHLRFCNRKINFHTTTRNFLVGFYSSIIQMG